MRTADRILLASFAGLMLLVAAYAITSQPTAARGAGSPAHDLHHDRVRIGFPTATL